MSDVVLIYQSAKEVHRAFEWAAAVQQTRKDS